MQIAHAEIDTKAAMRIAGARHSNWRAAMNKGHYTCAPETVNASKRLWRVDDLLCLRWFDALCLMGTPRPEAGAMAAELLKAMTSHPHIEQFSVYVWEDSDGLRGHMAIGTMPPAAAPNAMVAVELPVGRYRIEIQAAIDTFYAQEEAKRRGAKPH